MSTSIASQPVEQTIQNQNRQVYEAADIVQEYVEASELQPPERSILRILEPELGSMDMLDVGVGGGRTSAHFAHRVKSYQGTDYSQGMVEGCKRRFSNSNPPLKFSVSDARDMAEFKDSSYDFVLFSFNGIDEVSVKERTSVFAEAERVGRSGGYFCFSSHNLQYLPHLFNLKHQWVRHPRTLFRNTIRWVILHLLYSPSRIRKIRNADQIAFNDGSYRFRFHNTCYVNPTAQIKQLESWFENIRVFSLNSGLELKSPEALAAADDYWLYYLCEIRK